jgi:MFS transporter, UMF1 family
VNGWAMYDWANSVYNLVITTTFFPAYYAAVTGLEKFPNGIKFLGRTYVNTELKDYVLAFGFLLIAIFSPILSSVADYKGAFFVTSVLRVVPSCFSLMVTMLH